MGVPFHADRIAVLKGCRRRQSAHVDIGLLGNLGITHRGKHRDVLNFRSNVLRQIVDANAVEAGRRISGVEHSLPLDEAGGGNDEERVFL